VLIIMADDMGFSDIGCYGGEIRTPHIDGLAKRGVRFTQFYNGARCCPTRAALLTGLYAHQAGVGNMVNDMAHPSYQGYLNTKCVTIAEALRPAGYRTYMAGKWHVGEQRPQDLGGRGQHAVAQRSADARGVSIGSGHERMQRSRIAGRCRERRCPEQGEQRRECPWVVDRQIEIDLEVASRVEPAGVDDAELEAVEDQAPGDRLLRRSRDPEPPQRIARLGPW